MRKSKKLRALTKSAKMGKPAAMYRLGIEYQLGREVGVNMQVAAEWITASAELGYAPAIAWIEDYGFDDSVIVQAEA